MANGSWRRLDAPSTAREAKTEPIKQGPLSFSPHAAAIRRQGWITVALMCSVYMLNFLDKLVIGLAGHQIIDELGIDSRTFGYVNSLFYVLFIPASVIGGFLLDRYPTKRILIVMVTIWGCAMAPMLIPMGLMGLIAGRMLLGAGEGPTAAVTTHAVFKWFDEDDRVTPFAFISMGPWVGVALGSTLLAMLIESMGWRLTFFILGLASFLWLVPWTLFGREGPEDLIQSERESHPAKKAPAPLSRVLQVITSRTFLGALAVGIGQYIVLATVLAWLPLFLSQGHKIAPITASWIIAAQWSIFAVMPLLTARISAYLTRRGLSAKYSRGYLASVALIISGTLILLGQSISEAPFQISILLLAFGMVPSVLPLLFTTVSNIVPDSERGTVLGCWSALMTSGGLIAPTLMGLKLHDAANPLQGYLDGFLTIAYILLVGGALGLLLISPDRDRARFVEAKD